MKIADEDDNCKQEDKIMEKKKNKKKIEEAGNHSSVLTQEQIDELLKAIEDGEEDFRPVNYNRRIRIYDFRRPDKFSKYELRTISCAAETCATCEATIP